MFWNFLAVSCLFHLLQSVPVLRQPPPTFGVDEAVRPRPPRPHRRLTEAEMASRRMELMNRLASISRGMAGPDDDELDDVKVDREGKSGLGKRKHDNLLSALAEDNHEFPNTAEAVQTVYAKNIRHLDKIAADLDNVISEPISIDANIDKKASKGRKEHRQEPHFLRRHLLNVNEGLGEKSQALCLGPNCLQGTLKSRIKREAPSLEVDCKGPDCKAKAEAVKEKESLTKCVGADCKEKADTTCVGSECEAEAERVKESELKRERAPEKLEESCIGPDCEAKAERVSEGRVKKEDGCIGSDCQAKAERVREGKEQNKGSLKKEDCIGPDCEAKAEGVREGKEKTKESLKKEDCIGPDCEAKAERVKERGLAADCIGPDCLLRKDSRLDDCIGPDCKTKAKKVTCVGPDCAASAERVEDGHLQRLRMDRRHKEEEECFGPDCLVKADGVRGEGVPVPADSRRPGPFMPRNSLNMEIRARRPPPVQMQPGRESSKLEEKVDMADIQALERDAENLLRAIEGRYNAEINKLQMIDKKLHALNIEAKGQQQQQQQQQKSLVVEEPTDRAEADRRKAEMKKQEEAIRKIRMEMEKKTVGGIDLSENKGKQTEEEEKRKLEQNEKAAKEDSVKDEERQKQKETEKKKKEEQKKNEQKEKEENEEKEKQKQKHKLSEEEKQKEALKLALPNVMKLGDVNNSLNEDVLLHLANSAKEEDKKKSDEKEDKKKDIAKEEKQLEEEKDKENNKVMNEKLMEFPSNGQGVASNALPRGLQDVLPKVSKSMMVGQPGSPKV